MHSSLPLQITDWKFSRRHSVIGLFRWVERFCLRGACAVVAISPAVEKAARSACPGTRCVVIVNNFEVGSTASCADVAAVRARYRLGPDRKLVLYTGSFVALQALDLLVGAIPKVVAAVANVMFLMVGGEDAEIAELREQAERLGVSQYVLLERMQPQHAMPAYLGAADVLVSPRVQGINPPGKLLPYLASGRPVVATNTLVHNQLLTERSAILTAPDSVGIADGLIAALTDPVRVAAVVQGAEQLVAHYCSASARDAAYNDVLAAARSASPHKRLQTPQADSQKA